MRAEARRRWWDWGSHALVAAAMVLGAVQLLVTDEAWEVDILVPVALGVVAAHGRRWWLWLVPTGIGIGLATWDWSKDEVGQVSDRVLFLDRLVLLGTQVAVVAAAVAVGVAVRTRRRLRDELVREALLAERGRVSAEMHDVVGHGLALIVVASEAARYLAHAPADEVDLSGEERLASVTEALDQIHETAVQALAQTRALVRELGSGATTQVQPRLSDIPALVENAQQAGQLAEVILGEGVTTASLGEPAQTAVYRCVQESLTNALRHAPGTTLRGRLEVRDRQLVWQAQNPARAAAVVDGIGISAMRQRIAAVGGALEVSCRGGDFTVEARVPLEVR